VRSANGVAAPLRRRERHDAREALGYLVLPVSRFAPQCRPPSSRLITHVSAIGFATALSARALDPLIPSIAGDLAVDAASVALLSTAFALPFACVQPILGPLADMVGKIRLMVACLAVIIIVSFLSALAQSFTILMLARIVCGMATGGSFPVGLAIGAAFAGMVGDLLGWRAVFWIIGASGTAALLNAAINLRGAAARAGEP
jgi:MFS transporter, DHA1 family, inner membrane transport protein